MDFFNLLGQAALFLEVRKALFGEPTVPQVPVYNPGYDYSDLTSGAIGNEYVCFTPENDEFRIGLQNRLDALVRTRDLYPPCTRRYKLINNEIVVLRNQITEYDEQLGYI